MYKSKGPARKLSASKRPKSSNRTGAGGRRRKPSGPSKDSRFEDNKPKARGKRKYGAASSAGRFDNGKAKSRRRRPGEPKRGTWVDESMPAAGNNPRLGSGYPRKAKPQGQSQYSASRRPNRHSGGSYSRKGKGFSKREATIDIAGFIDKASKAPKPKEHAIKNSFADFEFVRQLQENLTDAGFKAPTPIQDQSIRQIMSGRDLVGLANTGTGKTGAFLLPLINRMAKDRWHKALIITPTRELASQINFEFQKFSKGMGIKSAECIGGTSMHRQLAAIRRRPSLVIGTPGRLKDLRDRGSLKFETFNVIVLDEVDRMLDMGFIDTIKKIMDEIPSQRQSLFFSATIPPSISKLVKQFLDEPVIIEVSQGQAAHNVRQEIINVGDSSMKFETLKDMLNGPDFSKVLIFSETKRSVEKITRDLYRTGYKVDSIHGDKRQSQRQKSLAKFKESRINILVATDVAARGLDIDEVTHVINYTLPQSYDDYIHRIGRTGRGSNKGIALTFV